MLLSDRKRASMCARCGPNMGTYARRFMQDGAEYIFRQPCRACGGHSKAFCEEAYS